MSILIDPPNGLNLFVEDGGR